MKTNNIRNGIEESQEEPLNLQDRHIAGVEKRGELIRLCNFYLDEEAMYYLTIEDIEHGKEVTVYDKDNYEYVRFFLP